MDRLRTKRNENLTKINFLLVITCKILGEKERLAVLTLFLKHTFLSVRIIVFSHNILIIFVLYYGLACILFN